MRLWDGPLFLHMGLDVLEERDYYSSLLEVGLVVRQKYSIMVLRLLLSIMLVLGGGASDYHLPPG